MGRDANAAFGPLLSPEVEYNDVCAFGTPPVPEVSHSNVVDNKSIVLVYLFACTSACVCVCECFYAIHIFLLFVTRKVKWHDGYISVADRLTYKHGGLSNIALSVYEQVPYRIIATITSPPIIIRTLCVIQWR